MKQFFRTLFSNVLNSFFRGRNAVFHLLAMALTFAIVKSGLDWDYFLLVRGDTLNDIFFPAVIVGALVPMLLPIVLIFSRDRHISLTGWTLAQAVIVGSFVSSFYKAFTGRIQPDLTDLVSDASNSFNFGFLNHGVFWGWPSSHTTIAFAMAFSLIHLYPKNRMLAIISICYALYVGIGVSFSVHWLSEFVAGAIMGTVIGVTVGRSFSDNQPGTVARSNQKKV